MRRRRRRRKRRRRRPGHVCAERVKVFLVLVFLVEEPSVLLAEVKLLAHGHLKTSLLDLTKYLI